MKINAIRQNVRRRIRRWTIAGGAVMAALSILPASAQQPGVGVSFQNGQLISGGEAFNLIGANQVATAADLGKQPDNVANADGDSLASLFDGGVAQVGCRTCGPQGYGGALGTTTGFGGLGGCEPCIPYRYAFAEVLYMQHYGDRNYTNSLNFGLDEFDFELGPRVTIGMVPDCVHGWEAGFTGPIEWERTASLSQTDSVNARPFAAATIAAAPTEFAFFDSADSQTQRHRAEYSSFEASRTLIGWQVAKILYGARYISYEGDYAYLTIDDANTGGFLTGVENQMFGGQVGLDLFYPIGVHATADFRGRAGAYLNFADADARVLNGTTTVLRTGSEDEDIAGVFEIGSGVRFNLGEALSIRAASEFWYLTGIATATGEARSRLSNGLARAVDLGDDVFMIGISLAGEFKW